MDVIVEDPSEFTPKRIIIAVTEAYQQETLVEFLKDALRKGLPGDLDDLFRRILGGLKRDSNETLSSLIESYEGKL